MEGTIEVLEGYVVDAACIRKFPRRDLLERARAHTLECAVMGHCVESGYGLVSEEDQLALLDAKATTQVLDTVRDCGQQQGIKLRVTRHMQNEQMETTDVEVV